MKYFIMVFILYALFVCDSLAEGGENINDIINTMKLSESLVKTGKGDVTWTFIIVDSTSSIGNDYSATLFSEEQEMIFWMKKNIYFVFDGNKIREDSKCMLDIPERFGGGIYETRDMLAFNGETCENMLLERSSYNDIYSIAGSIGNFDRNYDAFWYQWDPTIHTMNFIMNGQKILISDYLKNNNATLINSADYIDQKKSVLMSIKNIDDSDSLIYIWLAPELLYKPVKIEMKSKKWNTTITIEYKEYEKNIWFPQKIIKELRCNNQGHDSLLSKEIIEYNDDYEINIPIENSLFMLPFPPELDVYDKRIGENIYVIRNYNED